MAKKSSSSTLPPRHGGYKAAPNSGANTSQTRNKALPTPPAGNGGGSKGKK